MDLEIICSKREEFYPSCIYFSFGVNFHIFSFLSILSCFGCRRGIVLPLGSLLKKVNDTVEKKERRKKKEISKRDKKSKKLPG